MPSGEKTKLLWRKKKYRKKMLKSLWIKKGMKLPYRVWNKNKHGLQVAWNKGLTKKDKRVLKYVRTGENHHMWNGNKVSYTSLHSYIRKKLKATVA